MTPATIVADQSVPMLPTLSVHDLDVSVAVGFSDLGSGPAWVTTFSFAADCERCSTL
jgi:hypothetical protein